jgi:3-oxoadipate enol-lactonase
LVHALGTNLHLWDGLLAHLPKGLRVIRYDLRGHGQSDAPPAPYSMGRLITDAETVMDHLGVTDAAFLGLSVGGMIAQGLAIKRLDLVRALILSNTAARIGNAKLWEDRIAAVERDGLKALAPSILSRWFGTLPHDAETLTAMLTATPPVGYTGTCAAIAGTDFYTPTSGLRLPTLGIAGSEDRSTPPDLVRETVDLIPGSKFALMRRAGHLPCLDDPAGYACHVTRFLRETGHIR